MDKIFNEKKIEKIARVYKLYGPKDLRLDQEKINFHKKDLLIKTKYSAISVGTELSAYLGDPPLRPGNQYPRLQGYCNVGEVVSVGSESLISYLGKNLITFNSHRDYYAINVKDVRAFIDSNIELMLSTVAYLYHLPLTCFIKSKPLYG